MSESLLSRQSETVRMPAASGGRRAVPAAAPLVSAVFGAALLIFLALGAYQLSLPGLQYDEAKEAGLNAMQLVTGQNVSAFRDAVVQIGSLRVPLMVQDYIGSLNVLLAVPFLALGGVNAAALRCLPLLTGALTLWLAWRLAFRLGGPASAGATALLLAVSPTFIFWSRQGVFVTNLTALFFLAALLAGLQWLQAGRTRDLCLFALCCGLGLYAKLLFLWAIGAMVVAGAAALIVQWRSSNHTGDPSVVARTRATTEGSPPRRPATRATTEGLPLRPSVTNAGIEGARRTPLRLAGVTGRTFALAALCFALPLVPLALFNLQTGGTLASVFGNLGHSYYGVDNRAYWPHLLLRVDQLGTLLRGDHLWYLGESYANAFGPWLAVGMAAAALAVRMWLRKTVWPLLLPVALLGLIVAQSAFTVSDLFVTHFALAYPLIPLAGGLAVGTLVEVRPFRVPRANLLLPALGLLGLIAWAGRDGLNTLYYHRMLAASGGYGSHSDAIYRLSNYLEQREPAAPLALDWGMDAQLRFLSRGRVNPIEVFGYASLDRPDPGFADRVAPFLEDPNTLFVAHVPDETVFRGRVDALKTLAAARGLALREEARFGLRSGRPLFVVYRAVPGNQALGG